MKTFCSRLTAACRSFQLLSWNLVLNQRSQRCLVHSSLSFKASFCVADLNYLYYTRRVSKDALKSDSQRTSTLRTVRCENEGLKLKMRHEFTAISRKFVKNKVHATIPKGNMGYDQYPVSNDCSCRTYFCYFPSALANIYQWPPVRFF